MIRIKNKNKQIRFDITHHTLKILKEGFYENKNHQKINIIGDIEKAVENSTLFRESDFDYWVKKREELFQNNSNISTFFEVTNETSATACMRLAQENQNDKIFCLNFASAISEGGGFLRGAIGQEESLARISGLYPCLTKFHKEFYVFHKKVSKTGDYYTSNIIFSPDVPILKNDKGELLDNPIKVSFLTSPAVHLDRIKRYNFWNILTFNVQKTYKEKRYVEIMLKRLEYILTIAYTQRHKILVLGAWGCGIFKNIPEKIVTFFAYYLKNKGIFENKFEKVVFAINDKDQQTNNFEIFSSLLV